MSPRGIFNKTHPSLSGCGPTCGALRGRCLYRERGRELFIQEVHAHIPGDIISFPLPTGSEGAVLSTTSHCDFRPEQTFGLTSLGLAFCFFTVRNTHSGPWSLQLGSPQFRHALVPREAVASKRDIIKASLKPQSWRSARILPKKA